MRKEAIYDLNNGHFLFEDIEVLLDEISELYELTFDKANTTYTPKTSISSEHSWVSDETTKTFNKLVPKIKSMTKDMYSIIESINKSKRGTFDKQKLEKRFTNLKELRLLNNKFKHFDNQSVDVSLTSLVMMQSEKYLLDCHVNYKYSHGPVKHSSKRFSEFIQVFLNILESEKLISINRSHEPK